MFNAAPPVLVSVASRGELKVPTGWGAKVRLGGEKLTAGPLVAKLNLLMKASSLPPKAVWKAPAVMGKLEEKVSPST